MANLPQSQPCRMSRWAHSPLLPVVGVTLTLSVLGAVEWIADPSSMHSQAVAQRIRAEAEQARQADLEARLGPAGEKLHPLVLAQGQALYAQSCSACHAADGTGVAAVGGKDLTRSAFVTQSSDADLTAFIARGRAMDDPENTSGMLMPARGGNDELTDGDLEKIAIYLRGLQDPRRWPEGPLPRVALAEPPPEAAPEPAPPATPEAAVAVVAATGGDAAAPAPAAAAPAAAVALDPEGIKRGKRAYLSCLACHGKDGTGVKGVGKDLVHSPFVTGLSDAELVEFVKVGRGPTDAGNTTGLPMPPKGGNPALKDTQIQDIVTYLRSLQQAAGVVTP